MPLYVLISSYSPLCLVLFKVTAVQRMFLVSDAALHLCCLKEVLQGQFSAGQCSTLQFSAFIKMQYNTAQCMQCSMLQLTAMQCS